MFADVSKVRVKYSNWSLRVPIDLEDGDSTFLLNVGKYVPVYTAQER